MSELHSDESPRQSSEDCASEKRPRVAVACVRLSVAVGLESMSTIKEELTKWLSGNRNGIELSKALVAVLVAYLVDVVGVEDVKEVQVKSLVATAKEAFER